LNQARIVGARGRAPRAKTRAAAIEKNFWGPARRQGVDFVVVLGGDVRATA